MPAMESSANIRLIGWVASVRICSSPGTPTMRAAATRRRVTASVLLPFLTPKGLPVSAGLANGSNSADVQSSSIALNVSMICGDGKFSTWSSSALRYDSLNRPAHRSTVP